MYVVVWTFECCSTCFPARELFSSNWVFESASNTLNQIRKTPFTNMRYVIPSDISICSCFTLCPAIFVFYIFICALQEFYGASKRLSASLTPITNSTDNEASHWSANGALLTSIQSLGTNYSNNYGLRSNRLTALVWRAAPDIVRIGLFDLDRWYHAQMPTSIRYAYLSTYLLIQKVV